MENVDYTEPPLVSVVLKCTLSLNLNLLGFFTKFVYFSGFFVLFLDKWHEASI